MMRILVRYDRGRVKRGNFDHHNSTSKWFHSEYYSEKPQFYFDHFRVIKLHCVSWLVGDCQQLCYVHDLLMRKVYRSANDD